MSSPVTRCPDWSKDRVRNAEERIALLRVYREILSAYSTRLVTTREICEWHRCAFEGLVPLDYYAGNIRQVDPNRPCLDTPVGVRGIVSGSMVFMPGSVAAAVENDLRLHLNYIHTRMADYEANHNNLTDDQKFRRLVATAAVLIADFNKIHPFVNGNGRMTRLLLKWFLARYGYICGVRVSDRPNPEKPWNEAMFWGSRGAYGDLINYLMQTTHKARP